MIKAVQAANGTMTLEDLAKYEVSVRDAIQIDYRGYRMFSTPAPSSGTVALSTFKTIEGYNMSLSEDLKLNTHRLDEAIRFAYGAHNELGDPAFVDGQDDFEASMLNGTNAEQIRRKISDDRTLKVSEYNPKRLSSPETHGTSHVVTADASGMSITLTTTINLLFGSQVMVTETG
jgi:gamma-glutamyltranspeptidase/glutathione hydrolase